MNLSRVLRNELVNVELVQRTLFVPERAVRRVVRENDSASLIDLGENALSRVQPRAYLGERTLGSLVPQQK